MVSDEADFMLDICVVSFSGHPVPNSHGVIRIGSVNAVLFEMRWMMYKVFVSIHSPFIFLYCKVQLVLDE